jgi:hypothetical protein
VQQDVPCCYLIQSHLSHISKNHFSWIHFKITNSPLSTECFMTSSKQNTVHFAFNPCMQHDLPCCDGVWSYEISFCSGHHIFGGESSPYWFRNHCARKSCSAYYAVPKGKVLQINKSSSVGPHPKTKLSEALKKMPGLIGCGDWGSFSTDCTITQEASRQLPTAQARFRS